jgi:hypothetical protein
VGLGTADASRLGTIGTDLDKLVAVIFDERGRTAEVWEVEQDALARLQGPARRVVVRLPWVKSHGTRVEDQRVMAAARSLRLEVAF